MDEGITLFLSTDNVFFVLPMTKMNINLYNLNRFEKMCFLSF